MVIHMQSKKFSREDPKNQKRHRKVLGIYAEFAAIDLHEVRRLEEYCNKKIYPKNIDLDTLTASFGLETIFTLLPTSNQKKNPQILSSIFEAIQKEEYEHVVDRQGFQVPNPTDRRLVDVLGKNVYVYHTKHDGKLEYKVRNCIIY